MRVLLAASLVPSRQFSRVLCAFSQEMKQGTLSFGRPASSPASRPAASIGLGVPAPPAAQQPAAAAKVEHDSEDDGIMVGSLATKRSRAEAGLLAPLTSAPSSKKDPGSDDEDSIDDVTESKGKTTVAGTAIVAAAARDYHPVRAAVEWCPSGIPGSSRVPYSALVKVFTEIEATTKRIAITATLVNFFRSVIAVSPDDLLPVLYLCTNSLTPAYVGLELGVGDSLLTKALCESTGAEEVEGVLVYVMLEVRDMWCNSVDGSCGGFLGSRHSQVALLKTSKQRYAGRSFFCSPLTTPRRPFFAQVESKGDLGSVAEASRSKQKTLFGSLTKASSTGASFLSLLGRLSKISVKR
jgi:hypothetical protein